MGELDFLTGERFGILENRIEILEKKSDSHICINSNKICEIEFTQKMTIESIRKVSDQQKTFELDLKKISENIIAYREDNLKIQRNMLWSFIGSIVLLISMSVGYYITTNDNLNKKFLELTKDINLIKVEVTKIMGK